MSEKEGKAAILKIQMDMGGKNLLIYNQDRSLFSQIDDPYVSGFLAEMLEIGPMEKRYADGRIGTDENGDVTFRIDKVLPEDQWPRW